MAQAAGTDEKQVMVVAAAAGTGEEVVVAAAAASESDPTVIRIIPSFDDMGLHANLLRGIYSYGFEKPSAIQQRAIVPMIRGGDIIAQAQAGTGKTGAYSIALLQRVDFRHRHLQALVLTANHELAQQAHTLISSLGDFLSEGAPFCQCFIGGNSVQEDFRKLESGVVVAVGTPGRISDLIERGALRTDALRMLVLDEAEEMLAPGFADQVFKIFRILPRDKQVALFSATMPDDVLERAKAFMRPPMRITVRKDPRPLTDIKQFYVSVEEEHKLETLMDVYESASMTQSIIFANTRRKVDFIADHLNRNNHTASVYHGEQHQGEREKALSAFRAGSVRILVATDLVVSLDVPHVNIIVNFDLPTTQETYRRRIERNGRYGRKSLAISFVCQADVAMLREIDKHMEELPMDFSGYLGES